MSDQIPPIFTGDPYTIELRIVGDDRRVQLAGFFDHQHHEDALPDVMLNLAPLIAVQLGDWLQEVGRRAFLGDGDET